MDPKSKELLELICTKEVDALLETDIAFLKARSSYLSDEMKEKYSSVLAVSADGETSAKKKTKKSE